MKFQDMPYARVDMNEVTKQFEDLMKDLDRSGSGE